MLEYWYRAPGVKSRRVRIACAANSKAPLRIAPGR
jgi:hypothetical protein